MNKVVAKCWWFESSSGNKTYETLQYTDDSSSCNCPGWTRRVDAQGNRSCKHTRSVHGGMADSEAIRFVDYKEGPAPVRAAEQSGSGQTKTKRKKGKGVSLTTKRKISWK